MQRAVAAAVAGGLASLGGRRTVGRRAAPMLRRSKLTPDQPVLGEAVGRKAGKLSSLSLFSLYCSTVWRLEAAAARARP